MTRQVRVADRVRRVAGAVTTEHALLTDSWTAEVAALETAIGRITAARPLTEDCRVTLFEVEGDDRLHVNVFHHRPRAAVRGWSGPGRVASGCVYNRRFDRAAPARIIPHIREMVFA